MRWVYRGGRGGSSPHAAGLRVFVELPEPGPLGLPALAPPDQAVLVLVQVQEDVPGRVPLLGAQQPHQRILGRAESGNASLPVGIQGRAGYFNHISPPLAPPSGTQSR